MRMKSSLIYAVGLVLLLAANIAFVRMVSTSTASAQGDHASAPLSGYDNLILCQAGHMRDQGRQTFRFDTFGDEAFWGDALHLHQAIEGARFGGVGPGVSPRTAVSIGLKVDVDALPASLIGQLKAGQVNLDDPATTLAFLPRCRTWSIITTAYSIWD